MSIARDTSLEKFAGDIDEKEVEDIQTHLLSSVSYVPSLNKMRKHNPNYDFC